MYNIIIVILFTIGFVIGFTISYIAYCEFNSYRG